MASNNIMSIMQKKMNRNPHLESPQKEFKKNMAMLQTRARRHTIAAANSRVLKFTHSSGFDRQYAMASIIWYTSLVRNSAMESCRKLHSPQLQPQHGYGGEGEIISSRAATGEDRLRRKFIEWC